MMIASDPAMLAVYAKIHDLLDNPTPGWKKLKRIVRHAHVLQHMVNALKCSQRLTPLCISLAYGSHV